MNTSNRNSEDPTNPTEMARSSNSAATGGRSSGETPIANIKYTIYRPFPSTNQVKMVYNTNGSLSLTTTGATRTQQVTFRLNSVTDVTTTYTYTADPSPSTADTVDATPNIPTMRNFWATVYQYYTVIRSRWMFRVRPANGTGSKLTEADIFQHLHGVQFPPLLDTAGSNPIPWHMRKYFPQTIMKKVQSHPTGTGSGEQHYLDKWTTFYGEWYPGLIKHEVEEDDIKRTWNKIAETPKLPEYLSYVIQRSTASDNSAAFDVKYEFFIEYEVQLKELTDQYQFIRNGTTLNTDPPAIGATNPTTAQVFDQIN